MRWIVVLLIPFLMAFDTPLEDARAEARAKALMEEIRCVACENEPISQSGSEIAGDMRARVREMIGEGASDKDVRDWFAGRYGEFVLFRPSTEGASGRILWGLPFGLLFIGAFGLVLVQRRRKVEAEISAVSPDAFDVNHKKETDT